MVGVTANLSLVLAIGQSIVASEIDGLVVPYRDSPGVAVAVVSEGKVAYKQVVGFADLTAKEKLNSKTSFNLASCSKPILSLCVLRLVDAGRLKLQDSIQTYLPELPDWSGGITIEHLLTHTSGVPDYVLQLLWKGQLAMDWPREARKTTDKQEPTQTDAVRLVAGAKPSRPPGVKFEYSNTGFILLARIVEVVTKTRLDEHLRAGLFKECGMQNSFVKDERVRPDRRCAASYAKRSGEFTSIDYTPLNKTYGDKNVFSSLDDMARLCALLQLRPPISDALLRRAWQPALLNEGKPVEYGFGWVVPSTGVKGELPAMAGHSGSWAGFRTTLIHLPKRRLSIVILSNNAEVDTDAMATKIVLAWAKHTQSK